MTSEKALKIRRKTKIPSNIRPHKEHQTGKVFFSLPYLWLENLLRLITQFFLCEILKRNYYIEHTHSIPRYCHHTKFKADQINKIENESKCIIIFFSLSRLIYTYFIRYSGNSRLWGHWGLWDGKSYRKWRGICVVLGILLMKKAIKARKFKKNKAPGMHIEKISLLHGILCRCSTVFWFFFFIQTICERHLFSMEIRLRKNII